MRVAILGLAVLALLGGSCVSDGAKDTAEFPAAPQGPQTRAGHSVMSQRLQVVMNELRRETLRYWPQELDATQVPPGGRDQTYARAGELSRALSEAAVQLPDAVSGLGLTESELVEFRRQAHVLHEQAFLLSQAAADRDYAEMKALLREVGETCTACHRQFVEVSGPLR